MILCSLSARRGLDLGEAPGDGVARVRETLFGFGGLLKVELTRFLLRRKCDFAQHNHFKLDRCQPPEPALATLAMIRPLDP